VDVGIAIDFTCRRLEEARTVLVTELKRVQRSNKIGPQCFDAVAPIFAGRSGAGKVVDSVDCNVRQPLANITLYEMKLGIRHNGSEIFRAARAQIIETPNFMAKL
jgi:hypothetical protein